MFVRVKMCVSVYASRLKGGVPMGVACCQKLQNFHIDSQTCTSFSKRLVVSQRTAD